MKCCVCDLNYELRRFVSGWHAFFLCPPHAHRWLFERALHEKEIAIKATPQPAVEDDPRPMIVRYQKEGVIVKDIGCVMVEGYEAQGPAFVTELRTIDGKFQLVCVSPKEALTRTPFEFLIFRCRAILHGIRTMLGIEAQFTGGPVGTEGFKP